MSILPHRPPRDERGDPPIVAYWRERLEHSRAGAWVRGHRNVAAALAGLLVVLKTWRWLVFDLARVAMHPGHSVGWALHHLAAVLIGSAVIFLVTFAGTRLGLDRLLRTGDDRPDDLHTGGRHQYDRVRDQAAVMRR